MGESKDFAKDLCSNCYFSMDAIIELDAKHIGKPSIAERSRA